MANGALDANGIWLFGEDDQRDTFSALLNIGQQASSNAVGADRARIAVLEADKALGAVNAAAFVIAAGWTMVNQQARTKNGIVFWRIRFSRAGAPVTVPADGNIANQLIATFAAGWVPAGGMNYSAAPNETGGSVVGAVYDSGGFGIYITAVAPGVTMATGAEFTLAGIYPRA